ncbi:MAG: glycoside hydrolase family 28 protein [Bacteroidota bacterium]|nr:glycoside hydrolase family 28 protein [Bacteroidota bacterium]
MRKFLFIITAFLSCFGIYGYTLASYPDTALRQSVSVKYHFSEELKGSILKKGADCNNTVPVVMNKSLGYHEIDRSTGAIINYSQNTPTEYNVKDFGAIGNGITLDTKAINQAIDTIASKGGGTLRFPAGTYLSGSIRLKSNITLYLDQGAIIEASSNVSDYDKAEPNQWEQYQDYGHSHWHNSLIWGESIHNVSILGPGLIYGKGLTRDEGRDKLPKELGNKSIAIVNSNHITIRDISILHGGHFGILLTGVDNATIDKLMIDTNCDGMDIDCCNNVRITDCSVNSPWDDAIVLKTSYGLGYPKATENVTISGCYVTGGFQEGTLLDGTHKRYSKGHPFDYRRDPMGRIKLGTESNGDFKNIVITNCVFELCYGLALESVDGSNLQDISVSNITMRNVTSAAIFLRLGSRMRAPKNMEVGAITRVNISNIVAYNVDTTFGSLISISGIPGHEIEDIKLNDILAYYKGGGTKNLALITPTENEKDYPEPGMYGTLPSWGFFIRHVKDIEVNNVAIHYIQKDARPAFYLNDVQQADFNHVKWPLAKGSYNLQLKNVTDLTLHNCLPLHDITIKKTVGKNL